MSDSRNDLVRKALGAITKLDEHWEEHLANAGLETWEAEGDPLSHAERSGVADPRSGARLSFISWQASTVAPANYPLDWPFVPDHDVTFSRDVPSLVWDEVNDEAALRSRVAEALAESEWQERPATELPDGLLSVRWFFKNSVWRVLTSFIIHGTDSEVAVALAEKPAFARPNEEL